MGLQEKQEKLDLPDDPAANEKYPEPDVDNLRKQKDEVWCVIHMQYPWSLFHIKFSF